MFKNMKNSISKGLTTRIVILMVMFILMAVVLIYRLFHLQIINGESYLNDFAMSIKKERVLNSTRGEIYDYKGNVLAYNRLSYNVTFEDNGSYESTHLRNLTINSILYNTIKIIESHGDSIVNDFKVELNEAGEYEYNCTGFTLSRFKADVFGKLYIDPPSDSEEDKVRSLTAEEKSITAPELMKLLASTKYYGIIDEKTTASERATYGIPETYTPNELLQLVYLRSQIAATSYQRYNSTTLAMDVCEMTVSQLMENTAELPGIDVVEDYLRVYNDAEYFAPIIGYTGKISAEELKELKTEDNHYSSTDIVGKVGMEKIMETSLQGDKGSETLYVDNMGRTLSIESRVDPQAGNSLYLTLDSDLQKAAYKMLEQYIAGIVWSNTINTDRIEYEPESADQVRIPVYDIYFALFENNVLDVEHLSIPNASPNEKKVYQAFLAKAASIFEEIKYQLTTPAPTVYSELTDEMKAYQSYIVNTMLVETGLLNSEAVDKTDLTYQAWTVEETISLQEYLTYAISKNWIDINGIMENTAYLDSQEIYTALAEYIAEYLSKDTNFCKSVFRYMLIEGSLSGTEVCLLLFDQGVLEMDQETYNLLSSGEMSAYDFIREKIYYLEITPAQLALRPCSGAVVITDPNTGDVRACVTYPGYDNNKLVNEMDSDYYYKLSIDLSSPFYSRATQEILAPGSTFKMVAATAGVMEYQVGIEEGINCTGQFTEVDDGKAINCWIHIPNVGGYHGYETLSTAIRDSCNYYFNTIGYRLSMVNGTYEDATGMKTLAEYAALFGFDSKSGVEVPESSPHIATYDPVRAAMGQSDNAYTLTQIARYVSTLANGGTCYDLTMIDRVADSNGNTIDKNEAQVHNELELPQELWNAIRTGMRAVVQKHDAFKNYTAKPVAGKTGTAQESSDRPNHALFIGYAPYDDPKVTVSVRIANGYSSANAAALARDIFTYYFEPQKEYDLITGHATQVVEGNESND